MTRVLSSVVPSSLAVILLGCNVSGSGGDAQGGSTGGDPPLSVCQYGFVAVNPGGKSMGQSCTADAECEFDVCLMPGDPGNPGTSEAVNTKFGFCTRGCDCNNDTDSRLTDEEKVNFVCYNGPLGSEGKLKFVLPRCATVDDCASFDSGYSSCALPRGSGVFKTCLAL